MSRDLSDERRNRETVGEHRTLLRLLVECSRGLEARLRAGLREAGDGDIRPAHYAVFRYLGHEGSRVTELAEAAGMAQRSMGELVAHLEGLGFVECRPDPRDRGGPGSSCRPRPAAGASPRP